MDRMALWLVLFHFSFVAGCSMFRFVKEQGLALDNHVISTITASHDSKCRGACVENPLCFSMNVQTRDTGEITCELNNSSKSADPLDLQPRAGYEYYQMAELDHCTAGYCLYKEALPDGWYRFGSKLLKFFPERKTWEQARQFCQSVGGDLVSIKDEKENEFVHALIGTMPTNTAGSGSAGSAPSQVIAHWKLDGTDTDITLQNGASYVDKTLFLDGVDDFATSPAVSFTTTSFTIHCWVKLFTVGDSVFYADWAAPLRFLFAAENVDYLVFGAINDAGEYKPWLKVSWSITLGAWLHVAVVWDRDANEVYLFQNGRKIGTEAVLSDRYIGTNSHMVHDIGLKRDTAVTLNGYLKDLVILGRAMTGDELVNYVEGTNLAVKNGAWIGLNDVITEGQYQWNASSPVTYTKWGSGQPNIRYDYLDCVAMKSVADGGRWEVTSCEESLPFVCGKSV